ncbi:MAG: glycosyltransferase, partial [Mucilaginibacter sp.]
GLAALEAMACKVPVVSTNAGGLPELNIEGVTGYLKDIGDVDGMAERAIYILEDETRLKTFKENSLARAKEFDLSLILPMYENYYIEVIEKSRANVL